MSKTALQLDAQSQAGKKCARCKEVKSLDQFRLRPRRTGKLYPCSYCVDCAPAICAEWRRNNPEKYEESKRKHRVYCVAWNLKKYGLSLEDYEAILDSQGGGCAICGQDRSTTFHEKLSVDHCHATGKVRGLLCQSCNIGIGKFAEDTSRLWAAIEYLLRHKPEVER